MGQQAAVNGAMTTTSTTTTARATPPSSSGGTTSGGDMVVCVTPDDLLRWQSRRVIGVVCAAYLDKVRVTPTELLLSVPHHRRFDQASALRSAAERAAALQGPDAGNRFDRAIALVALANKWSERLAERLEDGIGLTVGPGRFGAARAEAQARFGDEADMLFHAVLASYLMVGKGWEQKLERLLALYDPSLSPEDLAVIDVITAEILAREDVVPMLLGGPATPDETMHAVLDSLAGRPPATARQAMRALPLVLKSAPDGHWRRALAGVVARELKTNRPLLYPQSPLPIIAEPVLGEMAACRRLFDRMRRDCRGVDGAATMAQALEKRMNALLSVENLKDLLQNTKLLDKVEILLALRPLALGPAVTRIDRRIDQLVNDDQFTARLLEAHPDPAGRVPVLGRLQRLFLDAGFGTFDREHYAGIIDDLQADALRRARYFVKLDQDTGSTADKVAKLLDLTLQEVFTQGRCSEMVSDLVRHYLARPDFLESLDKGSDASARRERIKDMLRRAGYA